jgi:protein-L-isoaspartate(D-aspartate) O-methyltransferase
MEADALSSAYQRDRRRLVERLRELGIEDLAVLHAFDTVPRHLFVPEAVQHRAYEDSALPIGRGQTISRPFMHATYLSMLGLNGSERVLEIGTGSGYQTALLGRLAAQVYSVERLFPLADRARTIIETLGFDNVWLLVGDGSIGWARHAPYDAILVTAASPQIPPALREQLAVGGTMLIPVGDADGQALWRVVRQPDGYEEEPVERARFVPLVGNGIE